MNPLRLCPHLVSFHPAHSGRGVARDLHVQPKFVSCHHSNDVLAAGAAGVQVDFGRVFVMGLIDIRQTDTIRLQFCSKDPEDWFKG